MTTRKTRALVHVSSKLVQPAQRGTVDRSRAARIWLVTAPPPRAEVSALAFGQHFASVRAIAISLMMNSLSRPPRAGIGSTRPTTEADRSVRLSNLCPHKPVELRVEVESLVKRARVGGILCIKEGRPIQEWDATLRRMVATPLIDSCVIVFDTRARAERLAMTLDGLARLGTHVSAKLLHGKPTPAKQPERMDALYQEAYEEKALRERAFSAFPDLPIAAAPLAVDPRVLRRENVPGSTHVVPPLLFASDDASSVVSSAARTTLVGTCRFCKAEGHFARLADGMPFCPVLVRKLEREAMQAEQLAEEERVERVIARKERALDAEERRLERAIALKERAYETELEAEVIGGSSTPKAEAPKAEARSGRYAVLATTREAAELESPEATKDTEAATSEGQNRKQKRMERRKAKSRAKRAAAGQ